MIKAPIPKEMLHFSVCDVLQICLIMDEVDGMSGGDRGGVSDLIQSIHRSKVPIICICNDKYNQKLRSLRNHTLELDYRYCCCQKWLANRLKVVLKTQEVSIQLD